LAALEAVKGATGLKPLIKWPNDLYVKRRKLAGILTEISLRQGGVEYVVLGLGLNVNWSPKEAEDIRTPATDIFAETGLKVSRNDLLIRILKSFEVYYQRVLSGDIRDFYRRWNEVSMLMGREVEIESGKETLSGRVLRIDYNGALIIEDDEGKERSIISGDVSVKF
jgi:BirA family biotin operon repressor/biotin-[acetyl-CoA-carboxylase] ligase